jgi:hypothetical protein
MFRWSSAVLAIVLLCLAAALSGQEALAQDRKLAIKNGETIELHTVYYVVKCRSIMLSLPEVEVLEGPQEVKLSIKAGDVIPRNVSCAKPVQGGTLLATAKDVAAPKAAKLTYRIKYKTKDGERQSAGTFQVSLFP